MCVGVPDGAERGCQIQEHTECQRPLMNRDAPTPLALPTFSSARRWCSRASTIKCRTDDEVGIAILLSRAIANAVEMEFEPT